MDLVTCGIGEKEALSEEAPALCGLVPYLSKPASLAILVLGPTTVGDYSIPEEARRLMRARYGELTQRGGLDGPEPR